MEKKKEDKKKHSKQKLDPKEAKIKELEDKNKELTDTLQCLQAEFENYKKKVSKDNEHFAKYSSARVIEKLLPILDSFEMALKNSANREQFVKGVELIFAQFFSTLESEGLRPMKSVGDKFDPYKHEVMLKEPSDKGEDVIIEEMQRGYIFNDKVLRHSKVKVSTGKQKKDNESK